MQECWIDDLKIHDLDDDSLPYWLMPPIKGLEATAVRVGSNPRAGDDGHSINSSYQGERRVELIGKIGDVGNEQDHITRRQALLAATKPTRDSNSIIVLKTLRFTDLAGNEYRLIGEVIRADVPMDNPRHSTFAIDFLAHSRFIESYSAASLTINPLTRGGFILPVVLPISFAEGSGGEGSATNNGDEPAYPIITLDGPLTNPRLENVTTGAFMALTLTIGVGEQVVIDMGERTIVQGGVTNRMSTKSSDSSFWALPAGLSEIRLTTGVAGEGGQAVLSWRHAYSGL